MADWVNRLRSRGVRRTVLALVLLALVVLAWDTWRAVEGLSSLRSDSTAIGEHIRTGDVAGAREASARLQKHSRQARDATGGLLWTAASHIPLIGDNFGAVATAAEVADAIATHSMPTFLDLAQAVQSGDLKPHDGRFDPAAFAARYPAVRAAAIGVDGPADAMARVRSSDLVPILSGQIAEFQRRVVEGRAAADAAANAFQVMPEMVGGQGPRDYLLLVQNPAEIRSTGGLPGTWAVIHADDGKLTMTKSADAAVMASDGRPALTADEVALFGPSFWGDPRDITIDPDFPRVAAVAAQKLREQIGVDPAAVFSVDPIAMAYVLAGTGPVTLKNGTQLTAYNAAGFLLNGLYQGVPDRAARQEYNSEAAHGVFDALVHGNGNQTQAIRGLVTAALQHRVLAWSPDPVISKIIGAEQLTGALAGDSGTTPQVGLFLNDAVQGKPDFFLVQSESVRSLGCDDGVQKLELSASYRSSMPANAAALSEWVVGEGNVVPRGQIAVGAYVVGPFGGKVDYVEMAGAFYAAATSLNGRPVAQLYFTLKPGDLISLKAIIHTAKGQTGDGKFTWTPGMELKSNPDGFASSC